MRKIAIAIGFMGMIMTALYGQEMDKFQIHGGLLTGVCGEFDESGNTVKLNSEEFNDPMGSVGAALKLMGSYQSDRWGVLFNLKFADGYIAYAPSKYNIFFLGYGYGYINFLNKVLTVEVGLMSDYAKYDTLGDQYLYFFDQGGVHAVVEPVDGLSFIGGVGMKAATMTFAGVSEGNMQYIPNDTSAENIQDNLAFGIRYSNSNLTIESAFNSGNWCTDEAAYTVPAFYIQGAYTGTENLTVELDNLFYNIPNFDTAGQFWATQLVGYEFGKVGTEVLISENLYFDEVDSTKNEYAVEPKVSYVLSETCTPYVSCEIAYSEDAIVSPKIGFKYSLMGCANLEAYYMYTTSDDDPNNVIQIDFSWYF